MNQLSEYERERSRICQAARKFGQRPSSLAGHYAARQIRQNTQVSRGQFWLELEKMFAAHDEVHINLRPGGTWSKENSGPESIEDWAKVEDYMGLFEHCEALLQKNLIDRETFGSIFSYRLHNILSNRRIVKAKLVEERDSWKGFLRLLRKLGIEVPKVLPR